MFGFGAGFCPLESCAELNVAGKSTNASNKIEAASGRSPSKPCLENMDSPEKSTVLV